MGGPGPTRRRPRWILPVGVVGLIAAIGLVAVRVHPGREGPEPPPVRSTSSMPEPARATEAAPSPPGDADEAATGAIAGQVSTTDGEPVAGARVRAWRRDAGQIDRVETATDGEGLFTLEGLGAGHHLVEVRHPESALKVTASAEVEVDGETWIEPVIEAVAMIEGFVVDDRGRPVGDAEIWGRPSTRTGPRGEFRIPVPERGHGVKILHPDFAIKRWIPDRAAMTSGPVKAVLDRGRRLSGHVHDGTGRGIAGARIVLTGFEGSWRIQWKDRDLGPAWPVTGPDGSFVLERVTHGQILLGLQADGRAPTVESVDVPTDADLDGLEIVLEETRFLRGRVVGEDDRGVPDADVSAGQGYQSHGFTKTEPDGSFEIADLPPGTLKVMVIVRGYESGRATVEAGQTDLTIRLTPGRKVEGRVDDDTGAPLERFLVMHVDFEGPDGRFVHPGVSRHSRSALVTAADRAPVLIALPEGDGPLDLGEIRLGAGVAVEGLVVDERGAPRPGVDVALHAARGLRTQSDSEGRFRIEGVGEGRWEVYADSRRLDHPIEVRGRSTVTGIELVAPSRR